MKRIFHPHITPVAKAALVLFVLLAVYYFWTRQPLFGLIATLVAVLATDRALHTTYVFVQNSSGVEEPFTQPRHPCFGHRENNTYAHSLRS